MNSTAIPRLVLVACMLAPMGAAAKAQPSAMPAAYLARCASSALAIGQDVLGHENERGYLIANILPVYGPPSPNPNVFYAPVAYVLFTLNGQAFLLADSATTFTFPKGGVLKLGRFTTADAVIAASKSYLTNPSDALTIGHCFSRPWDGTYPKKARSSILQ